MYIWLNIKSVDNSWINQQKLAYVQAYSPTLKRNICGLVLKNKKVFFEKIKEYKEANKAFLVDYNKPKGQKTGFFNAAK